MNKMAVFRDDNLSRLWARIFYHAVEPKISEISPLIASLEIKEERLQEISEIRECLDSTLISWELPKCSTVAETIFPISLWNPDKDRDFLFKRYEKICPRGIKKCTSNRNGVYFNRLTCFGPKKINQLDEIIGFYHSGNHRRSALQAAIFSPSDDLKNQRQRGFPCLQHVVFTPVNNERIEITGFYATQRLLDRAYGNFLGLAQLGLFMAHEMNLTLEKMNCISCVALSKPDVIKKGDLSQLIASCKKIYKEPELV